VRQRADLALVARGLAESRERAQALIISGRVYRGEVRVDKPSQPVLDGEELVLRGDARVWASRGALKMEKALDVFAIDPSGMVCLDVGAAAGGFTDVLLRRGARMVYAVDVGYGQLDWKLRQDPRVVVMERTNARALVPETFAPRPSLTVMDASFISIRLLLPAAAAVMGGEGRFAVLVKPQFEAGREKVGKHGVVRDPEAHEAVLRNLRDFLPGIGLRLRALDFSPVKGPKGNIEFLADIGFSGGTEPSDGDINALVTRVHREL